MFSPVCSPRGVADDATILSADYLPTTNMLRMDHKRFYKPKPSELSLRMQRNQPRPTVVQRK